jgi:hypothetical protein
VVRGGGIFIGMKSLHSAFLVNWVFLLLGGISLAAPKEAPDPLIGRWRWTDRQIVECRADQTFAVEPTKRGGTWKLVPDKAAERKYVLTWDGGLFVDRLTMSRDEKELKGENQDGKKIRAAKIP